MKHELTAKRLQIAMSNMNINAQELSNRSGVAKASISQYVNGSHKPSNISSGKMASVLKVNPLWLMGFDVPMQAEEQQETNLRPGIQFIHADGTVKTFDISSLVYSIMESVSEMPPEQQEMVNNMVGGKKRKNIIYAKNPHNNKQANKKEPFASYDEAVKFLRRQDMLAACDGKNLSEEAIIQMANAILMN